ncbi:MAG: sulfatase-like hydrolase/transferase [Armatimonadota bacterium]
MPPNIIVFFSDQQRWDTLGCYGQRLDITPNLDQMAREGVRFEQTFTCQPVCGPARACIQTGKYATEIGCFRNDIALPLAEKTLAHMLSDAGYEVGYLGKWHLASDSAHRYRNRAVPPERRGGYKDYWLASDVLEFTSHGYDGHLFDAEMRQVDFQGYRADCLTDFALDYLRTRDGKRPFFLFISYIEPHFQNDHACFEGPLGSKERFAEFDVPGDLVGTGGDWREEFPDYLGCCHSLDTNLGRMREELARLGMADDTTLFYTSDHGCHFKTRNAEYKRSCHDSSLRIPMLACGPGFSGGKVVSELVSLIDLPPTVLAAGGVEPPATMRGRPVQQLLQSTPPDWPQEVFAQISEDIVGRTIRTKRWKYAVWAPCEQPYTNGVTQPSSEVYVEQYLYDIEHDPHERKNLVDDPDYRAVRAELAEVLMRRMVEAGEAAPQILPAGQVESARL